MTASDPRIPGEEPAAQPQPMILARLAAAVRRQDWFVVALEIAIVVLGVIIGFQVTAWGEARSDAAKEQVYLRQLAADLRESDLLVAQVDSAEVPWLAATGRVVRAYYTPEPPPRDSLIAWMRLAWHHRTVQPLLGTAEALVATGDLRLIRSDSLRKEIVVYLQSMRREIQNQNDYAEEWVRYTDLPMEGIDPSEFVRDYFGPVVLDSLSQDPDFLIPPEPRRVRFPLDVEAYLANRSYNRAWFKAYSNKRQLRTSRAAIRESGQGLLRFVEAALAE